MFRECFGPASPRSTRENVSTFAMQVVPGLAAGGIPPAAELGRHMNPPAVLLDKNRLFFVAPPGWPTMLATEDGLMVKPSYAVKASPPTGSNHVGGMPSAYF